jgi:hypothetical protein
LYSLRSRASSDRSEANWQDAALVRSSSWVRQSLRRWCSDSSASHSRRKAASISLRTWWARDSTRGRGTGAASGSAPYRSRCQKITSISSGAGRGTELDAPLRSPRCWEWAQVPQLGPPPPLRRRRSWRRRSWTPSWDVGGRWRCPGGSWVRSADTTFSRFLLLRARPAGGPSIWWRRRDLGGKGGRSPDKQKMG